MPSTVPNIKPKNNRMLTSTSLKTHSVWKDSIKYDPYAEVGASASESRAEGKEQFRTLLKLANTGRQSDDRFWKGPALKGVFPEPMFGYAEETHQAEAKVNLADLSDSSESDSESMDSDSRSSDNSSVEERSSKKRKRSDKKSKKRKKSKSKKRKRDKHEKKRKHKSDKKSKKKKKKKSKKARTD
mmetsp:Transcript_8442/g.9639  ORF Transcript_8442/g.9639 Transcript_8442/m.9639 type:complete len:185 (+) Transcript_8442:536-1090(+)|eukprot:CAMPEP_0184056104 /NCGR_PEP_ID=MMETSP0956-20121227/7577_1 /TAXON_ID=627963 /ORGANISM="Aplanochytrium sp, Strain PBS07" /LENGTH=184 /DNA_ID=CAMNT_0026350063 /DNA_START=356 /DNA_END=910 /DNA_ORIENTATION=+